MTSSRTWSGTVSILRTRRVFQSTDDRLADLVPPPRKHRHRYHGVFAPNHRLRKAVTSLAIRNIGKRPDATAGGHAVGGHATEGSCDTSEKPRSHDTSRKSLGETAGAGGGRSFPSSAPTAAAKTAAPGNAFWDLRDGTNRLHAAHESFSSPAMLAEVPLAGLSFVILRNVVAGCGTGPRCRTWLRTVRRSPQPSWRRSFHT